VVFDKNSENKKKFWEKDIGPPPPLTFSGLQ